MNIHDWITILAATIVVVGWFVNSALNRRHEIAKKRMEYRLEALHSFLPAFFALIEKQSDQKEIDIKLSAARTKFQLYCHKAEIDAFERMVVAIETKNQTAYLDALSDTLRLVREGIRCELGLGKYQYPTK